MSSVVSAIRKSGTWLHKANPVYPVTRLADLQRDSQKPFQRLRYPFLLLLRAAGPAATSAQSWASAPTVLPMPPGSATGPAHAPPGVTRRADGPPGRISRAAGAVRQPGLRLTVTPWPFGPVYTGRRDWHTRRAVTALGRRAGEPYRTARVLQAYFKGSLDKTMSSIQTVPLPLITRLRVIFSGFCPC